MHIDFLLSVFEKNLNADAVVRGDEVRHFDWLLKQIRRSTEYLQDNNIRSGEVVMLEADFSAYSVAMLLAAIGRGCIIVPATTYVEETKVNYRRIAQVQWNIRIEPDGSHELSRPYQTAQHDHYTTLRERDHPGLVLFSSGSTGDPKGAVHDFSKLLTKFQIRRKNFRTLTFLLFDHIGGVDTLLYSLSNGSVVITVEDRSPDSVCRAIEQHRVEVLPVTPTFLNLLLLSEAYRRHDMSSLKYITYGTEVMPQSTLNLVARAFPAVALLQKYGTTEVGTLRSKSESSESTWVRIGGEGYDIRVVEGILQIQAQSAMLGYLNALSPFTEDGWFVTGDLVEQKGEFIRFLGRESEIINVGGEKVYPTEVESVIQQVDNVAEVSVFGEPNPLIGNIVCATVSLYEDEETGAVTTRIKRHCAEHLERYKVPVKITVTMDRQHSERFKKMRPKADSSNTSDSDSGPNA